MMRSLPFTSASRHQVLGVRGRPRSALGDVDSPARTALPAAASSCAGGRRAGRGRWGGRRLLGGRRHDDPSKAAISLNCGIVERVWQDRRSSESRVAVGGSSASVSPSRLRSTRCAVDPGDAVDVLHGRDQPRDVALAAAAADQLERRARDARPQRDRRRVVDAATPGDTVPVKLVSQTCFGSTMRELAEDPLPVEAAAGERVDRLHAGVADLLEGDERGEARGARLRLLGTSPRARRPRPRDRRPACRSRTGGDGGQATARTADHGVGEHRRRGSGALSPRRSSGGIRLTGRMTSARPAPSP